MNRVQQQAVEAKLGLKHAFGTVYHPQSQGKVEIMNQSLKNKLGKVCAQTKPSWVDALPEVLMSISKHCNRVYSIWTYDRTTVSSFQVVERTSHAVRLQGKGENWYHWSQCAQTEAPTRILRSATSTDVVKQAWEKKEEKTTENILCI